MEVSLESTLGLLLALARDHVCNGGLEPRPEVVVPLALLPAWAGEVVDESFREAVFAAVDAQEAIRYTTRVLRDDLPTMTKREAALAKTSSEYVARFLPSLFPSMELVAIDEAGENSHSNASGLITAVFAQLARGLLNNEAYRVCANPECNRLFTPREMGRRLDTKYCCSDCQERARRLRYVARHS